MSGRANPTSNPANADAGTLPSPAEALVREINRAGALLLWDPQDRVLRSVRGWFMPHRLRDRLLANFEGVVIFLSAQAREGDS